MLLGNDIQFVFRYLLAVEIDCREAIFQRVVETMLSGFFNKRLKFFD